MIRQIFARNLQQLIAKYSLSFIINGSSPQWSRIPRSLAVSTFWGTHKMSIEVLNTFGVQSKLCVRISIAKGFDIQFSCPEKITVAKCF